MSNSEVDLIMVIMRSLGDQGFPRKHRRVMGPGPMGLDLMLFLTKTGVRDVMTYVWMPPQAYQRAMYVYISFLKSFRPPLDPNPLPQPPVPGPAPHILIIFA